MNKNFDIISVRQNYPSMANPVSSNWVYEQVRGGLKSGFKIIVISPTPYIPSLFRCFGPYRHHTNPSNEVEEYNGTRVLRPRFIKFPHYYFYNWTLANMKKTLLRTTSGMSTKIIHSHFGYDGVVSVDLKKKLGCKLITTFYGGDVRRTVKHKPGIYKRLKEEGDLFLAISDLMKKDLIELGFPEDKIEVWRLGVDTEIFSPSKKVRNPDKPLRFLTIARLSREKGIHHSIKAFARLKRLYEEIEYVIVGFGPEEARLKSLVRQLGLESHITIINNLHFPDPRRVVLEQLQLSDIFVLSSYSNRGIAKEGTPIVLMEAQSCGLPCISSLHSGIHEVIVQNETGFLFKQKDVEGIFSGMRLLFENRGTLEHMGNNATAHIKKNYNFDFQIEKLCGIYDKCLTL